VPDAPTSSIIEQATKRLAELQRAGIVAPEPEATAVARPLADPPAPPVELAISRLPVGDPAGLFKGPAPGSGPAMHAASTAARAAPLRADEPQRVEEPHRAPVSPIGRARSRHVDLEIPRLERAGYIVGANASARIGEEFRIIKRPLLLNMQSADDASSRANMVMVTSSVAGEGKTFTAINLALSMAMEMDKRVLLVDADVADPSIPDRLGIEPGKGLLDLLSDPALELHECVLRTNVDKLTLLPAGTRNARSTELLASEAMSRLVAELSTRYPDRVVIFDAPPLLASSESRVLATYLGQILFVVEADRTSQSTVSDALATVESCPLVMTVLNKARRSASKTSYGTRH
jgi:receptor protein-tyrosine kinase